MTQPPKPAPTPQNHNVKPLLQISYFGTFRHRLVHYHLMAGTKHGNLKNFSAVAANVCRSWVAGRFGGIAVSFFA